MLHIVNYLKEGRGPSKFDLVMAMGLALGVATLVSTITDSSPWFPYSA